MIYLHPSLGISNAPATPPRITDPSYIDRIYEFVGGNKAQFSVVIEASNGTVLDDIKETRLTAHLFDVEGRELTEYLTPLSLYWEEHNETWTEVGRGWSYLVNDNSRFLRLLRVRVSQLDIMTALGLTIDAETKKTLAGIMVQQEVKITSSSYIYSRIPSVEALHDSLVNDVHFRELVKGHQGDPGSPGKDATPIRPNLFDIASLDKNSREQGGLRIDEVTVGKRLSAGTINIHGGRDLTRVTTGVALQLDLIIYRTSRENGEFKRYLTLRTMRPPNDVIYYARSKPYPEEPGTYHIELICPINKEQSENPKELYIHGWLLDWGRGFMDCELRNVKVEYLYEGEPQKCSAYIPNTSDMIPLLPKIENGEWLLPDQLTRKYLSTGVRAKGEDGNPGKDAPPIRPNLLEGYMGKSVKIEAPSSGPGADFYYRFLVNKEHLKDGKAYVVSADFEWVGGEKPDSVSLLMYKNKPPHLYSHTPLNGRTKARVSIYIPAGEHNTEGIAGYAGRAGKTRGVVGRYSNIKLEEAQAGETEESTTYLPHQNDLVASTAEKITKESIYLSRIQNGMARYADLTQVRKILDGHQVRWDTLDDNYLRPIRQQQDELKTKQNESEQRLGEIEQDIIKFAYRAVRTDSSDWSDYTNDEYVGQGHTPDPWGGGGIDGYIRKVHNYELYRSMDNTPPAYIEQSKKELRSKEYKIGDKYHRDNSANIIYDIHTLSEIKRGTARHWQLFTTPHATSILRYGGRTRMGNPNMQGYAVGNYYNIVLEAGTTYDIYAHNNGGSKYDLFIVKNGSYQ